MPTHALAVLDFWFGPADDPAHDQPRRAWFAKDAAFDAEIARRFGALVEDALAGRLDGWITRPIDPRPALALLILLDQFTRNIFRGTPRAFAGDARALQIARAMVASGADRALSSLQRSFVYLPFEHAEDLSHQRTAVQLFEQLARDDARRADLVDWARRHHDVVARFGRFPHRNAVLGRLSSADELAFLATPGSSF